MPLQLPIRLTATPSPISTKEVTLSGVLFEDLQTTNGDDSLYFACRDPKNAGRARVESLAPSISMDSSSAQSQRHHSPKAHNVRSAVHEYGGGSFTIAPNGQGIIYTDYPSNKLYWQKQANCSTGDDEEEEDEPILIYHDDNHRFADFSIIQAPAVSSPHLLLLAVMEDHTDPTPSEVKNSIVCISLDGKGTLTTLASGHDFYASPQFLNNKLAFIAWNHPNMPWDSIALYIQQLDPSSSSMKPRSGQQQQQPTCVYGGENSDCSVAEPRWTSDDRLLFLCDATGWYNLYEYNCQNDGVITCLLPKNADFCAASQGWILGLSPYTILSDGTVIASYSQDGESKLVHIPRDDGTIQEFGRNSIGSPTCISSLCAAPSSSSSSSSSGGVYFLGGSTVDPMGIWYWEGPGSVARKVRSSMEADVSRLLEFMSVPRLVQFPSEKNRHAFGYYYAPANLSSTLGDDFKPPLLVKAHGGPTSQSSTIFRVDIQFWTSRGFAVLDVDYGGSTGHGKDFRQSLRGKWGVVDVDDVCNGALWCVQQGLVNGEWLCIDGRSAGGYTTMAALTFRSGVFSAGASLYGISDLVALKNDTHKFESRYLDGLVGPYPEKKDLYNERCPINYTGMLNCPMILLQGDEDKVVPPDQAVRMFHVLKSKGLQTALVMYKGEQHGFRKGENVRHALLSEYEFFCAVFGFEAQREDGFPGVKIGERVDV